MLFINLSYNQLLVHGVHIGHSIANTLLYSAWLVSAYRQSLAIINLFKSLTMFRISFILLTNIVVMYGPIWFINLDQATDRYIKYAALNCGELSITTKWIRGSISNYRLVFNAYKRLMRLSALVYSPKKKKFMNFFSNWYLSRYSWPRAVFISSLHSSYFAAKEAYSLKIPVMAIVDTNTWSQAATVAIPGNDESLGCLVFYNDIISSFIMSRKFSLVSAWFFNIRGVSRVVSFIDWFMLKNNFTYNIDLKPVMTFNTNTVSLMLKAAGLFLTKGATNIKMKDHLRILRTNQPAVSVTYLYPIYYTKRFKIIQSFNFHFLQKFWMSKQAFKKNVFTDKNFKLRFLTKKFYYRKFLYNRFFKYTLAHRKYNIRLLACISIIYFYKKYVRVFKVRKIMLKELNYWNFFSNMLIRNFKLRNSYYIDDRSYTWRKEKKRVGLNKYTQRVTLNKGHKRYEELTQLNKQYYEYREKEQNKQKQWNKKPRWNKWNKGNTWNTTGKLIVTKKTFTLTQSLAIIYLAKRNKIKNFKYYISQVGFDIKIPKSAMLWDVHFMSPMSNRLKPKIYKYFFRKPPLYSILKGNYVLFAGYVPHSPNKLITARFSNNWLWF